MKCPVSTTWYCRYLGKKREKPRRIGSKAVFLITLIRSITKNLLFISVFVPGSVLRIRIFYCGVEVLLNCGNKLAFFLNDTFLCLGTCSIRRRPRIARRPVRFNQTVERWLSKALESADFTFAVLSGCKLRSYRTTVLSRLSRFRLSVHRPVHRSKGARRVGDRRPKSGA